MDYLYIGLGGFLGAVARYIAGKKILEKWTGSYPMGTFIINLSGAFILGLLAALFAKLPHINDNIKLMVTTGFLGAYTTFSTYTYECIRLFEAGEYTQGIKYVLFSTMMGILMAYLGLIFVDYI